MAAFSFWEKTVEYAFVLQAAKESLFDEAAALAWVAERHGADAYFGKGDRYVLVEFKKSKADLSSEVGKFKSPVEHGYLAAASTLLAKFPPCHFFVYMAEAKPPEDGSTGKTAKHELVASEYFLPTSAPMRPSIQILRSAAERNVLERSRDAFDKTFASESKPQRDAKWSGIEARGKEQAGLSRGQFTNYLEVLNQHREKHLGSGDGDGDGSGGGFELVLAVAPNGQLLSGLPVSLFRPTPAPSNNLTSTNRPKI